jgi:hypothetical protein
MLFFFIARPTDPSDPIKTIVTSMAAVLTTSMTLRIILSVRGTLAHGGSFALSASSAGQSSSHTTHVLSTGAGAGTTGLRHAHAGAGHGGGGPVVSVSHGTFTLSEMRGKPEAGWAGDDAMADVKGGGVVRAGSDAEVKVAPIVRDEDEDEEDVSEGERGVKVTVDREIGYDTTERYRK